MAWYKKSIIFVTVILFTLYLSAFCFDFRVLDSGEWSMPPMNDTRVYNDWASENRFRVSDTIRFEYRKGDSLAVVNESDYEFCITRNPLFSAYDGETVVTLHRPGPFYFISRTFEHCSRGQRMIVRVMAAEHSSARIVASSSSLFLLLLLSCLF